MDPRFYKHRAPTERAERFFGQLGSVHRSCLLRHRISAFLILAFSFFPSVQAQQLTRDQWGGVPVSVSHDAGKWIIAGKRNRVTVNERTLAIDIETPAAKWSTVASTPEDMLVKTGNQEIAVGLSQAKRIEIVPYDAGFKTGVAIVGRRRADEVERERVALQIC